MAEGHQDALDALVEQAGAARVDARRPAPFDLATAEQLLAALTGSSPTPPAKKKRRKRKPPPQDISAAPAPAQPEVLLPPPLDDDDLEITQVVPAEVEPGSLPPLPRAPTPVKDVFDAVLDEALAEDDVLAPMESVEAEIEVDFMDDFGEATAVADIDFEIDEDPLDAQPEEYDIDVDVDDFERLEGNPDGSRAGFYNEDNEPTKAIKVEEVDMAPPPDAELNVRSSIKKLFRKK